MGRIQPIRSVGTRPLAASGDGEAGHEEGEQAQQNLGEPVHSLRDRRGGFFVELRFGLEDDQKRKRSIDDQSKAITCNGLDHRSPIIQHNQGIDQPR